MGPWPPSYSPTRSNQSMMPGSERILNPAPLSPCTSTWTGGLTPACTCQYLGFHSGPDTSSHPDAASCLDSGAQLFTIPVALLLAPLVLKAEDLFPIATNLKTVPSTPVDLIGVIMLPDGSHLHHQAAGLCVPLCPITLPLQRGPCLPWHHPCLLPCHWQL